MKYWIFSESFTYVASKLFQLLWYMSWILLIFSRNTLLWIHPVLLLQRIAELSPPSYILYTLVSTVYSKVYRLGGETDSAIRWRKRTACDVVERLSGSWSLRTFLKLSFKMRSIFCEFVCYNKKLCVNKPTSFFSNNTSQKVNKKMTRQQLK